MSNSRTVWDSIAVQIFIGIHFFKYQLLLKYKRGYTGFFVEGALAFTESTSPPRPMLLLPMMVRVPRTAGYTAIAA